jgi:hypothetical protein
MRLNDAYAATTTKPRAWPIFTNVWHEITSCAVHSISTKLLDTDGGARHRVCVR